MAAGNLPSSKSRLKSTPVTRGNFRPNKNLAAKTKPKFAAHKPLALPSEQKLVPETIGVVVGALSTAAAGCVLSALVWLWVGVVGAAGAASPFSRLDGDAGTMAAATRFDGDAGAAALGAKKDVIERLAIL